MSTAGKVDFYMDQGADWATQFYWLSGESIPFPVQSPIRMEIRDEVGGVAAVLQTDENSAIGGNDMDQTQVLYVTDSGLIQLFIGAEITDKMGAGRFNYDVFVSYKDSAITGKVRLHKLLSGRVFVNGRTTRNI